MKPNRIIVVLLFITIPFFSYKFAKRYNFNSDLKVGQVIDSLNGVSVYYNGGVDNTNGRNLSSDNYNIGIKYQCVEFVKRYYFEHLNHKMPDSYGHAKDFFDDTLRDGHLNEKRNLIQYLNGSAFKPKPDDLIIFDGTAFNKYGHVAIISKVTDNEIEIIQQNPGPYGKSRERLNLIFKDNKWSVNKSHTLGWLRINRGSSTQ